MLNYWIQLTPNVELHLLQLQNPLITASPELQIWREKSLFEASVHQYINIIKSGTQTRLRLNFFVCVSGVAPHVHPCFLFHPFQQKQERFRMKNGSPPEKVTPSNKGFALISRMMDCIFSSVSSSPAPGFQLSGLWQPGQ